MKRWLRPTIAFIAGMITWMVVVTLINFVLRATIDGYTAAEPKLSFTLGMMLARLAMAAATSVAAGAVTGWVAPASERAAWAVGIVTLALFIPAHIKLWHAFPIWYHLTFLLTLVPLVVIGSRLARRHAADAPGIMRPAT
jgi:ABC-type multidrug transport system permease subunit